MPDDQVPPLAYVALQQLYPQARQVKWRRVQAWYQASYTQSQAYRLVRFDSNGDVQATGHNIALGTLPPLVQRTLTKDYPTRTICRAAVIENARTGASPTRCPPAKLPSAGPLR